MTRAQADYEKRKEKLRKIRASQKSSIDSDLIRNQIHAFQLLSHNLDLPESLQATLTSSLSADNGADSDQNGAKRVKQADNDTTGDGGDDDELESRKSDDKISHNFHSRAIRALPFLARDPVKNSAVGGTAETIISNRIGQRILELEALPANLGTFSANNVDLQPEDSLENGSDKLKIRSLVELKALRLLTKQKSLRQHIIYNIATESEPMSESMAHRAAFRRVKTQTAQELRLTEQLELQQRQERERRQHREHVKYVLSVCNHSNSVYNDNRTRKGRSAMLFKAVSQAHGQIEREESKRAEKMAKQRLQALRANDEDAYIKLLDQTKDTRITHLLKQTNSFLDSLSQAVKVQQQDNGAVLPDGTEDGEKVDYYSVAHRVQEKITKQPSILVGGTLKEYQIKGLEWMVSLYNNNLNGILADEMGLGKTIQSISLITYLIEAKHQPGPYLVIVPLSTLTNWNLEFEKWAPSIKRVVYKGPPTARKSQQGVIRSGDFQVLLTTYEYIIKDRPVLSKIKWTHMIIDEGHRMKNAQSKLSETLTRYYYSRHRLILTGTPLQNNLPELWALLNFVLPKIFNSVKSFDEWFNTPFANTGGQDKMELTEEETLLIIRRLHKVLRPFLLRRLKKDVESDLPDKVEKVLKCKMSALQSRLYMQMLKHNVLFVGNRSDQGKMSVKGLNNKIMQLRKICNHPFVFEEVESYINPTRGNTDELWRVAGKFELLDRILPKFKATGHRVLIFFQMTQVMDIMEDYLRLKGMQYLRLDGSTKADERSEMLKLFNAEDSPYFAFLLSTRAGGLGLNLQTADTVIIYDTDWNPHQDLQAQDRAHRIGQTKEVRILRLITEDSVEEVILDRAHAKLDIDGKVIQAGKFDNKSTAEEQEAFLRQLLESEEAKRHQNDEDEEMDDDELNEILARNDDEEELFKKVDEERHKKSPYGRGKEKDRLFGEDELPEDYRKDIEQHLEEDRPALGRGARERKTVYYDDGLTEEQWLDAVDNDEVSLEDAISRKRQRMERRRLRKSGAIEELGDEEVSTEASTPGKRKRGRPRLVKEEEDEADDQEYGENENEEQEEDQADGERPAKLARGEDDREKLVRDGLALYDAVVNVEDESGRKRSELFMEVPSKRLYPDYYKVIKKPIALDVIHKRIISERGGYKTLAEAKADFDLMFDNARTYNMPESFVYVDADEMSTVLNDKYEQLVNGDDAKEESVKDEDETPKKRKRRGRPSIKLKLTNNN